ncbi:MAG: hypothetical protein Kow0090_16130 [Myxococcota bacterium]
MGNINAFLKSIFAFLTFAVLSAALLGCSCEDEQSADEDLKGRGDASFGDDDDMTGDTGRDDDDNDAIQDDDDISDDDDNDDNIADDDDVTDDDDVADDDDAATDDDDIEVPDTPGQMCSDLPTELDFGTVEVGFSSSKTIEIENCGGKTLEILEASLDPVVGEFSRRGTYDQLLAYKEKAVITIVYTPQDVGADTATMKVVTTDAEREETIISLKGAGTKSCDVRCVPTTHEFGTVEVGLSAKAKFMCENRGAQAASITDVALQQGTENNFSLDPVQLPVMLNQYKAMSFSVEFAPQRFGQITATVEVKASTCPDTTLGISLVGYGAEDILPACWTEQSYKPKIKWEWDAKNSSLPEFTNVFMAPVIAPFWDNNMDGVVDEGDMPVVVFSAYNPSTIMSDAQKAPAAVTMVDGKKGIHIRTFDTPGQEVHFTSQLAIGDINNDGIPEIIANKFYDLIGCKNPCIPGGFDPMNSGCKHNKGSLIALDRDGKTLWESEQWTGSDCDMEDYSAPYLADLNADGEMEIIFGPFVYNNEGKLIWSGKYGRGNAYRGFVSVAHDLDGDGKLEVIAGNTAYRYDGTLYWQADIKAGFPTKELQDGIVAVADLDLDGKPEVIINTAMGVYYLNGQSGSIIAGPLGNGQGGCCVTYPAVADLTGDGYPEVVIPNYLKYQSTGGSEDEEHIMLVLNHDGSTHFELDIHDMTGASFATVFDFDGDGAAEIVYADEGWVYIIRGRTGDVLYQAERGSKTGADAPIVVDVDNNKHAELVLPLDGFMSSIGVRVYFTEPETWMGTRRIWNQASYNITNINSNLTVPKVPADPWKSYNIYRGNAPICRKPE